jgi:hypothetical protein
MGVRAMNKLAASISCLLPKSNDIVFVILVKGQILVDLSCQWLSIKLKGDKIGTYHGVHVSKYDERAHQKEWDLQHGKTILSNKNDV